MLRIRIPTRTAMTPSLLLVILSCLCSWLNLMALPYMNTGVMSLSNRGLLAIWIVGIGIALIRRSRMPFPRDTVWVLVVIGFSVASWMVAAAERPSVSADNMLRMLGFLTLPLMLIYSMLFRIDERCKDVIFIYGVMISLLFIHLYHSDLRYKYTDAYGVTYMDAVTLGYPNPNQTAMYLFLCATILFIGAIYIKSKYLKCFFALDGCYISWIMLQTEARTAALLLAAFGALSVVAMRRRITVRWVNLALFAPAGYVLLWPILRLLQQDVTILNDSIFNGRELIFARYFDNLNLIMFLFGDLSTFRLENLHNGYIAIAASMGMVVCIGYVLLFKSCILRNLPDTNMPAHIRVAFVGVLCAIMYTCGEAAFFVGGSNYAIMFFALYVLTMMPTPEQQIRTGGR